MSKKINLPFFRSPYNYDLEEASNEAVVVNNSPSLTNQSMAEEADINVLMKRFGLLGVMPVNPRLPEYGDFSEVTDYQSALHAVMDAEDKFMELTPEVRQRFSNSPQLLMEFMSKEGNYDEGLRLGLFNAKVAPKVEAPVEPPKKE